MTTDIVVLFENGDDKKDEHILQDANVQENVAVVRGLENSGKEVVAMRETEDSKENTGVTKKSRKRGSKKKEQEGPSVIMGKPLTHIGPSPKKMKRRSSPKNKRQLCQALGLNSEGRVGNILSEVNEECTTNDPLTQDPEKNFDMLKKALRELCPLLPSPFSKCRCIVVSKVRRQRFYAGFATPDGQVGMFAAEVIPPNELVVEYIDETERDEIVVVDKAYRRNNGLSGANSSEVNGLKFQYCELKAVDSTPMWRFDGFINHSCFPNMEAEIHPSSNGRDRILFFSTRRVFMHEQLTFDHRICPKRVVTCTGTLAQAYPGDPER
ncbi:SET domain protein [Ancylostoma ceylanicum]|uniref:SET domain protein n=1 Tax=Ancylostoma ceylanicum TaxID=53326 RepID=A0A0D6MBX0_9BILA|nr:SET domain protein [Ancylostoma ceylanicum]